MTDFNHDYAIFDEFGLKSLLCMNCGTLISERQYVPMQSKVDPSKTISCAIGPVKNSSFREVSVKLSDGSYTNLKLCGGCENGPINFIKAMVQIQRANNKSGKYLGLLRDPSHIAMTEKFSNMEIVGKLTIELKQTISLKGV